MRIKESELWIVRIGHCPDYKQSSHIHEQSLFSGLSRLLHWFKITCPTCKTNDAAARSRTRPMQLREVRVKTVL